jgi:hypothetical protein
MELGRVGFKNRDIVDLLTLYGDVLDPWLQNYLDLEQAADLIRTYDIQFVPDCCRRARTPGRSSASA